MDVKISRDEAPVAKLRVACGCRCIFMKIQRPKPPIPRKFYLRATKNRPLHRKKRTWRQS